MRRVLLPSGGEIVMEETEALVSIGVNTGGHKGDRKDGKNFILQASVEAAMEVARQMRLRNLGGLVIIDFIDMKNKGDQRKVFNKMKAAMADDKAKHNILPISQLGIMQITRQRHDESNSSGYTNPVHTAMVAGSSSRRGPSVLKSAQGHQYGPPFPDGGGQGRFGPESISSPKRLRRLRGPDSSLLERLERNYGLKLSFEAAESYHVENYKVIDESTGKEIR